MGSLNDEIGKVIHRKRRGFRYTQSALGQRIGVSGSYVSTLESGKASPRIAELEELAAHFRTTAYALIHEAAHADEGYLPAAETSPAGLDDLAAELPEAHRELAREFLLFLRERERSGT